VLYRRSVIYAAPSGTGKTSMLRAGLVPRLEALGVRAVYLRCRADSSAALAAAIWPDDAFAEAETQRARDLVSLPLGTGVAAAVTAWHRQRGGKLVLILDQVEAALGDPGFVGDVLGFAGWPPDADVAVVLSIREDHLARLYARAQTLEPGIPLVRLPPLPPDGARAAITGPLTEARLAIEPELLDALLADLQRAATAIGPEMGWGTAPAVFPPHLQLACSVLYEELAPGDATLTLAHYQRLGGFDAIVGEHLERVLDTELTDGSDRIARALFVALVTASHERAMRAESELIAMVGDAERAGAVLEVLRSRGLLMRVRGDDGEPSWELAHDSLVPRVLAWLDARDLARRRAIELVRYHLRRSRAEAPSLLGREELRELGPHVSAIAELDAEWQRRGTGEPWSPSRLIARSRQVLRRQVALVGSLVAVAVVLAAGSLYRNHLATLRQEHDAELKLRNLGKFTLSLEPFDWDPVGQRPVKVDPAGLDLRWELRTRASEDEYGDPLPVEDVVRGMPRITNGALVEHVEARGGRAFLLIWRGRCTPSVVPLHELPGYATREQPDAMLLVPIPTCAATLADTIAIPAGTFVYGGVGEPPSSVIAGESKDWRTPQQIHLPGYRIDRTEVTNAAFQIFGSMVRFTEIAPPVYPPAPELKHASEPKKPVTGISWHNAHAYCRYVGKDLPSSRQWVKAMRGGERLPGGVQNPIPQRNLPWGAPWDNVTVSTWAQLYRENQDGLVGVADVGSHLRDVSPYGVLDLAGNAEEWTSTPARGEGLRIVRGGSIAARSEHISDYMAIENPRAESASGQFELGMRCALSD
jgi:formylglycine-generating enzyme required for sulfatase activity